MTNDVSVISVDLTPDVAIESNAMGWLSTEERRRWEGYQFSGQRRQFALTRAALRAVLCAELGCENELLTFCASEYGKPFALVGGKPAEVRFNVSHSGRFGLLALTPAGRVGVDVEERRFRDNIDNLSAVVFSPREQAELAVASGQARLRLFFDLWAMKEALVKALGTGFHINPALFEVPSPMRRGNPEGTVRFPDFPGVQWRLVNLGNEDFAAAVAYESCPG